MKISELPNAPDWLKNAWTENADVVMDGKLVVWRGGYFRGGEFLGGYFRGGDFRGGEFLGGQFRGGYFRGGEWKKEEDRLLLFASALGIVPDADGMCRAYRTTYADGSGRYNNTFKQIEGEYFEDDAPFGTDYECCVKGIHVSSAAVAYRYFEATKKNTQLWQVDFHVCDLLACAGEKCRIRGGVFTKIDWPF